MFGDMEKVTRVAITTAEFEQGVEEIFVEERSSDWFITYYVYKDKVTVVESMNDVHDHATETCDSLAEAIEVASTWC